MAISTLESPKFVSRLNTASGTGSYVNSNGYIYVYTVGGTYSDSADQVTVWSDKAKTTPIPQPIQLDANGTKEIWFDGTVSIRVEDENNTPVDTIVGVQSSPDINVSGQFNLVTNGSFETDTDSDGTPDNWSLVAETDATIDIDSTSGNQYHGANALHFDCTGGTAGAGTATSDIFEVQAGNILQIGWAFKQTGAATGTYKLEILYYDYNKDSLASDDTVWNLTSSAPTSWTPYNDTSNIPATAKYAKVRLTGLGNGGADETGECWFDNIIVIDNALLVTLDGTQTLTNKTLTSPTIGTDFTFDSVTFTAVETAAEGISASDVKFPTSNAVTAKFAALTTIETAVTTTTTDAEWTTVPSGCSQIIIGFNGVGAAADIGFRLGSTTYKTSGYLGGVINDAGTTSANGSSAQLTEALGGGVLYGSVILTHMGSNAWVWQSQLYEDAVTDNYMYGSGYAALAGEVDRIVIDTVTFPGNGLTDSGTVNVVYKL